MTITHRGTHSGAAWDDWVHRNTTVESDALRLAREAVISFDSPTLVAQAAGTAGVPVAITVDDCDDLYVLTADAELYQYDPQQEWLRRRECVAYAAAVAGDAEPEPTALCVTDETLYVADAGLQGLVALSSRSYQTRWTATGDLQDPVALAGLHGIAYVLDRAAACIYAMDATGFDATPVVDGLSDPLDLSVGPDGQLLVLDHPGGAGLPDMPVYVVRRYEISDAGVEPVGDDPVTVAADVHPRSIQVLGDDGFLLGVGPDAAGERGPRRYLESTGRFEPLVSFGAPCDDLARSTGTGDLYALTSSVAPTPMPAGESLAFPGVYRLRAGRQYRRDATTGSYTGTVWRRFDAGEVATEWHRLTSDHDLPALGTSVTVRYHATDDPDVGDITADFGIPAHCVPLLTAAGVTGSWRLVEVGAASLSTLCSVPTEQVDGWIETSIDQVAAELDDDIESIDGIGKIYGKRLKQAGLWTIADLYRVDRSTVDAITEAGAGRIDNWYADAESIIKDVEGPDLETTLGIDSDVADLLADIGVTDVPSLLAADPTALTEQVQVPEHETARWVEQATGQLDRAWSRLEPAQLAEPSDALLTDAVGRYLWVALDILGTADATPTVETLRVYFPRDSYLRHLPAIYREDEESAAFLERFLAVFESVVMDIDATVTGRSTYLDTEGIPAEALSWLGSWLAVDPDEIWPLPVRRALVSAAPQRFKQRGTARGILETLALALGDPPPMSDARAAALDRERAALESQVDAGTLTRETADAELRRLERPAFITEHRQRHCPDRDEVRELYDSLVGCPQCFAVLLDPATPATYHDAAARLVDSMTPATAVARTLPLRDQFELTGSGKAGHTYLGVNSSLTEPEFAVETATLGQDTALGAAGDWGRLELASRLDRDATLS